MRFPHLLHLQGADPVPDQGNRNLPSGLHVSKHGQIPKTAINPNSTQARAPLLRLEPSQHLQNPTRSLSFLINFADDRPEPQILK